MFENDMITEKEELRKIQVWISGSVFNIMLDADKHSHYHKVTLMLGVSMAWHWANRQCCKGWFNQSCATRIFGVIICDYQFVTPICSVSFIIVYVRHWYQECFLAYWHFETLIFGVVTSDN
jgi:hypothetical protein